MYEIPSTSVHHADRGEFAHGLKEDSIDLRKEPGHELGSLGGGSDGVAEEVPTACEQGADGRSIGSLHDEGPRVGEREERIGDRYRGRRLRPALSEDRRRVLEDEGLLGMETVRLGARFDAEATGRAVVEVEENGHEACRRVDLGTQLDAVAGASLDAPPAALAVQRLHSRSGPVGAGGHEVAPPFASIMSCKLLANLRFSKTGAPTTGSARPTGAASPRSSSRREKMAIPFR
jgi:hypothetical protein